MSSLLGRVHVLPEAYTESMAAGSKPRSKMGQRTFSKVPRRTTSFKAAEVSQPDSNSSIVKHAFETFGERWKAQEWLATDHPLLGGRTPYEAISDGDSDLVETILTRIDHGVYS
jgi:uncharacterized protein (DUF2384 family)